MCISEPVEHEEPAGQLVHCPLLDSPEVLLNEPSLHGSGADAPASQYEPALHSWHSSLPLSFMNLPASQLLHEGCLVAGCTAPGLHGVCTSEPVEQEEPAGQSRQSAAFAFPEAPE